MLYIPAVTISPDYPEQFQCPPKHGQGSEFRLREHKVRLGRAAKPGANNLSILDAKSPELLGLPVREILNDYIQKDFLAATRSQNKAGNGHSVIICQMFHLIVKCSITIRVLSLLEHVVLFQVL